MFEQLARNFSNTCEDKIPPNWLYFWPDEKFWHNILGAKLLGNNKIPFLMSFLEAMCHVIVPDDNVTLYTAC